MGVADRKEREKEEMKVKILEAAKKLFLGKGFEKTSIRNIADAIEYSPGTIYLYFKDKNELLFNLHVEAFNGLTKELSNIDPELSPIDALEVMGEQYIKFAFENPELYELMFVMEAPMESLECKEEVWDDGMKAFDLLRFLVDRCQKDGYLATYEVDDASLMIWSFVHGLVTLKSRKRLDMFCDSEEDSLTRMMRSFNVFLNQIKCGKS
ncbi:TetR/AcrR family transcriptional regulator [Jiulongibacter sediminis]|jgi:AcrR family transcriptional regulator|uniref:TetR/AcrR family transcriptional regulator n=1 Tax=Jiulongibacter sediminis TaxID=1605367 RepID=UPI0026ED0FB7|nr:TetR/AcrR family transcriptional regulator [Jiulongibacter sediminis]